MGTMFVLEKFENIYKSLSKHHAMSSSYNNQSKRQTEACIKFVIRTIQKCHETNTDINMALLQIRSTMISPRFPRQPTLLFNRLTRSIPPQFNRQLVLYDNDESNPTVLIYRHPQSNEATYTHKNIPSLPTGSTAVVQQEDGQLWMHGTIIWHGSKDHNGSHRIRMTKMGYVVTRRETCEGHPYISRGLSQKRSTENQPTMADRFNKLVDQFKQLCKNEHSIKV